MVIITVLRNLSLEYTACTVTTVTMLSLGCIVYSSALQLMATIHTVDSVSLRLTTFQTFHDKKFK